MYQDENKRIFAIGIGFYDGQIIQYEKIFTYIGKKDTIILDLFDKIKRNNSEKDTFICIMETSRLTINKEESFLILQLFSNGILTSINEEHRNLLREAVKRVDVSIFFKGSYLINISTTSIFDRIPSLLLFNKLETNKFSSGDDNYFHSGCLIGEGLIIGNGNLWSNNIKIFKDTCLRELRSCSGACYGKNIKAGDKSGIQGANNTMIIFNPYDRRLGNIETYKGDYLLLDNTEENRIHYNIINKIDEV